MSDRRHDPIGDAINAVSVDDRFRYHPPTPEQVETFRLLRDAAYHFALVVEYACRPSRERERALDGIDAAVMAANASVARHDQADGAYAGAQDLHNRVLEHLRADRPESVLVAGDPATDWTPDLPATDTEAPTETAAGRDPWAEDLPPYAVLAAGIQAIASDAIARGDHHTAGMAHTIMAGDPLTVPDDEPRCRVCGCTENRACFPPCSWVEPDLCSACASPAGEALAGPPPTPLVVQVDEGEVVVLNPEVLGGRGVLIVPPGVRWVEMEPEGGTRG